MRGSELSAIQRLPSGAKEASRTLWSHTPSSLPVSKTGPSAKRHWAAVAALA